MPDTEQPDTKQNGSGYGLVQLRELADTADADGLECLVFRAHAAGGESEFVDAGWPA